MNGELEYGKFKDLLDPKTKKPQCAASISRSQPIVAHEYMIRLERQDFGDQDKLKKLAEAFSSKDSRLSPEVFKKRFEKLMRLRGGL